MPYLLGSIAILHRLLVDVYDTTLHRRHGANLILGFLSLEFTVKLPTEILCDLMDDIKNGRRPKEGKLNKNEMSLLEKWADSIEDEIEQIDKEEMEKEAQEN